MIFMRSWLRLLLIAFLWTAISGCRPVKMDEAYITLSQNQGQYDHLTWSPDGKQILLELDEKFAILNPDGTIKQELPISLDNISGPSTLHWLNDTQIAYSLSYRQESGERISKLMRYDLNQQKERVILSTERINDACWSQPEQVFVFLTWDPADSNYPVNGNALSKYDLQSETLSRFLEVDPGKYIEEISCNPAAGTIAIVIVEGESGNDTHMLLLLDLRTMQRQIPFETSNMKFDSPTWSPDGKWIAVRSLQGKADQPIPGILLIADDGSRTITIMEPNFSIAPKEIAWSPVTDQLLIRAENGFRNYALYLLDLSPWLTE